MRTGSKIIQFALLAIAYAVALYAATTAFSRESDLDSAYRFLIGMVSALLLLVAHGYVLIRRAQARRFDAVEGVVRDVTTDVMMSVWELLFGWLGVGFALVFLYHLSPPNDLSDWYPRLFLCLVVYFAAMSQRALIFVFCLMPFVLVLTGLEIREGLAVGSLFDSGVQAVLLVLDIGVLVWAARIGDRNGALAVAELELPHGAGHVGGRLAGVIHTGQSELSPAGYQLDLSCIRQHKTEGGARTGEIVWHHRQMLAGVPSIRGAGETVIPVDVELPAGLPPSSRSDSESIAWVMHVSGDHSNMSFHCAFQPPVGAQAPAAKSAAAMDLPTASKPAEDPLIKRSLDGLRISSPAHWNSASELITVAYFVFWFQMMWLATALVVDRTILVMFGGGLWLLGSLLIPWVTSVGASIGDGVISIRRKGLFGSQDELLSASNVEQVEAVADGLRTGLVEAVEYYKIRLRLADGSTRIVAAHLCGNRRAEAVAESIWSAIEKSRSRATAIFEDDARDQAV